MQKCRRFVCHLFIVKARGRESSRGRPEGNMKPFSNILCTVPALGCCIRTIYCSGTLGVACHGMKPAVLAAVHPLAPLSFPSPSLSTQFGCQKHVKGVVIVVVVIVIGLQ